ncbi:MAG: hypothetical protein J1E40_09865 [Oscillospiraceae bacterium]|nr:hypothetical protein [Oscillospiraceae bacterium]
MCMNLGSNNNSCCWIIVILLLLWIFCGSNCGCVNSANDNNNCGCC